jgi:hypothetical protein
MIKFTKPENLDGAKLIEELLAAGIKSIPKDRSTFNGYAPPLLDGNNDLWLAIDSKDESKAAMVVAAHTG